MPELFAVIVILLFLFGCCIALYRIGAFAMYLLAGALIVIYDAGSVIYRFFEMICNDDENEEVV